MARTPFDVRLNDAQRTDWTHRLVEEIRTAKQARAVIMEDHGLIDFAYSLYEQESQKGISRDQPRYGSADLTSPIWTENVDALSARAVHTMFKQEPFWVVEGIGQAAAEKAPVVEQYMQFRQEQMRLQKVAKRVVSAALIETGSVFEVCEDTERCVSHQTMTADVQRSPLDQSIVLDAKTGNPIAARDPQTNALIPAPEGADASVEVHETSVDYKRRGAYVRRRSMKDFVFLPSHAEDDRDVWGRATRFWLPLDEIQRKADDGEYGQDAVDLLGGDNQERQQRPEADRQGITVTFTPGTEHAEKELWRIQFWGDVDGQGLACYTAIISEIHSCILSLRYDWLERWRTVYVNPYPCPYSVYGYSMVLTKLLTTGEEHTAWRNMNADRGTLKSNAPLKRLRGSSWDPTVQPFGAGEVIDVAAMNEIEPFQFDDVTIQAMNKEQQCVTDAQRLIGMNDIAIGQISATNRTLGENQMATQQSFVRTDDPISNIEEALEEVGELIHAIEVQALREMEHGMEAPASVAQNIQYAGDPSFDGTFTAGMIEGQYRFKPRGSTDTADPEKRKQQMTNMLGQVFNFAKVNPVVAMRVASPAFAGALMSMVVDEYRPRDKAAFLDPVEPPAPVAPTGAPAPGAPPPAGGTGAPSFGAQILPSLVAGLPPAGVH